MPAAASVALEDFVDSGKTPFTNLGLSAKMHRKAFNASSWVSFSTCVPAARDFEEDLEEGIATESDARHGLELPG